MNNYILGILWALGRYVSDPHYQYFFLRHRKKYFLEIVRRDLDLKSNVHHVTHHGKLQYRLKVTGLDITELQRLGWEPRNNEQRSYPRIHDGHRDFIRAYLEIHSTLDIVTIRKRLKKIKVYKQPRLRIYGNKAFLKQLTEILASEVGTGVKKVQRATRKSEVSGILYYQSPVELKAVFGYLYRPSVKYFDREYYENFREVLKQFEECAMTLTRTELEQAILQTIADIKKVKQQIAQATDPKEKKRLTRKKKELQYLQLWHLSQLENLED